MGTPLRCLRLASPEPWHSSGGSPGALQSPIRCLQPGDSASSLPGEATGGAPRSSSEPGGAGGLWVPTWLLWGGAQGLCSPCLPFRVLVPGGKMPASSEKRVPARRRGWAEMQASSLIFFPPRPPTHCDQEVAWQRPTSRKSQKSWSSSCALKEGARHQEAVLGIWQSQVQAGGQVVPPQPLPPPRQWFLAWQPQSSCSWIQGWPSPNSCKNSSKPAPRAVFEQPDVTLPACHHCLLGWKPLRILPGPPPPLTNLPGDEALGALGFSTPRLWHKTLMCGLWDWGGKS